eukprot:TRINITY_DN15136_c0_g1_i1.p1 TRINITY_DN15136_c0_g1~~TRINITY_DN15136_c0_g1_i1.p1  ORF type:complete len:321 (+),score=82.40 TRINITY_DN15136_c0_g1_i1:145-963(+)
MTVGIVFIPIGVVIFLASNQVVEVSQRYDADCTLGTVCKINLHLPHTMKEPVYMYYKLDNFYQNHRRYVKSRNDKQLRGEPVTNFADLADCDPRRSLNNDGSQSSSDFYLPCGLIAYSMFNDTFQLARNDKTPITLRKDGIAWPSDMETRFHNPSRSVPGVRVISDFEDEDFANWMRNAGLPSFRKLYRIIDEDLPAGNYTVRIANNYPVSSFSGQKSVVLSTSSWIGGKNPFLGYAFIIIGSLCFVLGVVFALKHKISPRKPGDLSYLDRK